MRRIRAAGGGAAAPDHGDAIAIWLKKQGVKDRFAGDQLAVAAVDVKPGSCGDGEGPAGAGGVEAVELDRLAAAQVRRLEPERGAAGELEAGREVGRACPISQVVGHEAALELERRLVEVVDDRDDAGERDPRVPISN